MTTQRAQSRDEVSTQSAEGRPFGFTERQWKLCQSGKISDVEFGTAMYRQVTKGPPALTVQQAEMIAKQLVKDQLGLRCALAVLATEGKRLANLHKGDRDFPEALAQAAAWMEAANGRYRGLADILQAGAIRVQVALSVREDCQQLLDEARAALNADNERAEA